MKNKIKEVIDEASAYNVEVCSACGHLKRNHWWNGGGNPYHSGYDQCLVEDCDCVWNDENAVVETRHDREIYHQLLKAVIEEMGEMKKEIRTEEIDTGIGIDELEYDGQDGKKAYNLALSDLKAKLQQAITKNK